MAPDNKTVALCIANTLSVLKDKDRCYEYFEKAAALEGDNYKSYICYAIAQSDFKDYDKAVATYKKSNSN